MDLRESLKAKTVKALRLLAKTNKFRGYSKYNKKDLIQFIIDKMAPPEDVKLSTEEIQKAKKRKWVATKRKREAIKRGAKPETIERLERKEMEEKKSLEKASKQLNYKPIYIAPTMREIDILKELGEIQNNYYEVPSRDIIGMNKKKYKSVLPMDKIIKNNLKSKIGYVNYNKYGEHGYDLEPISKLFCDNFCLSYKIPKHMLRNKGRTVYGIGQLNSDLGGRLEEFGLPRTYIDEHNDSRNAFSIKAIGVKEIDGDSALQKFKVSLNVNTPINDILAMLTNPQFYISPFPIIFNDIDFTRDYANSFDKQELIEAWTTNHGFLKVGQHGQLSNGDRIICDNDATVGRNCLSFVEKCGDIGIRGKLYNKFAQSLESKSVREAFGHHLFNWCNNPDEGLKETIRKIQTNGLTRLEISFYDKVPTMDFIREHMNNLATYSRAIKHYRTPIQLQWKAFAEHIKNNVIVFNLDTKEMRLGMWQNELTGNIGGVFNTLTTSKEKRINDTKNYKLRLNWCLTELALDVPLMLITMKKSGDSYILGVKHLRKKDHIPTRLTKSNFIYSRAARPVDVKEFGLTKQKNIDFYITNQSARLDSTCRTTLVEDADQYESVKPVWISPNIRQKLKVINEINKEMKSRTETKDLIASKEKAIAEKRQNMANVKKRMKQNNEKIYRNIYTNETYSINKNCKKGDCLTVYGLGSVSTRFGDSYILGTDQGAYWSTKYINTFIDRIKNRLAKHTHRGKSLYVGTLGQPIFIININGFGWSSRNKYPLLSITSKLEDNIKMSQKIKHNFQQINKEIKKEMVEIAEEKKKEKLGTLLDKSFTWKDTKKLDSVPLGTRVKIIQVSEKPLKYKRFCAYVFKDDAGNIWKGNEFIDTAYERFKSKKANT